MPSSRSSSSHGERVCEFSYSVQFLLKERSIFFVWITRDGILYIYSHLISVLLVILLFFRFWKTLFLTFMVTHLDLIRLTKLNPCNYIFPALHAVWTDSFRRCEVLCALNGVLALKSAASFSLLSSFYSWLSHQKHLISGFPAVSHYCLSTLLSWS